MEQVVSQAPISMQYSGVVRRWVAAAVDGLIVAVFNFGMGLLWGVSTMTQVLSLVAAYIYYVWMIGKWGQTLGKKWLKIKVQTGDGQVPGYKRALVRETVGKLVSGLVLGIGYAWAIWDKDKQAWHDKMAQTVVVRV